MTESTMIPNNSEPSEPCQMFRKALHQLIDKWRQNGIPSTQGLDTEANRLVQWKQDHAINGLWDTPPRMATATLDDGMGQGLRIIHQWADILGMEVMPIGLLKSVHDIIEACERIQPDLLGMTVLQFDSETDLLTIRRNIAPSIEIIAGGPVFRGDPDLARRVGIGFVARDVAEFMAYVMKRC